MFAYALLGETLFIRPDQKQQNEWGYFVMFSRGWLCSGWVWRCFLEGGGAAQGAAGPGVAAAAAGARWPGGGALAPRKRRGRRGNAGPPPARRLRRARTGERAPGGRPRNPEGLCSPVLCEMLGSGE